MRPKIRRWETPSRQVVVCLIHADDHIEADHQLEEDLRIVAAMFNKDCLLERVRIDGDYRLAAM